MSSDSLKPAVNFYVSHLLVLFHSIKKKCRTHSEEHAVELMVMFNAFHLDEELFFSLREPTFETASKYAAFQRSHIYDSYLLEKGVTNVGFCITSCFVRAEKSYLYIFSSSHTIMFRKLSV